MSFKEPRTKEFLEFLQKDLKETLWERIYYSDALIDKLLKTVEIYFEDSQDADNK